MQKGVQNGEKSAMNLCNPGEFMRLHLKCSKVKVCFLKKKIFNRKTLIAIDQNKLP